VKLEVWIPSVPHGGLGEQVEVVGIEQANALRLGCISTIIAGGIYRAILPAFIRNSRRDSSSFFWVIEAASFVFIPSSFD
jgi:hypothetical protein